MRLKIKINKSINESCKMILLISSNVLLMVY